MKRILSAVAALLLISTPALAGSYLMNNTGETVYGLQVVFSEPVSIISFGDALTAVEPNSESSTFTFQCGQLEAWEGQWINWEPADAVLVCSQWLLEAPATPFAEPPFPYWGFTIHEIGGGGYSHGLMVPSLDGLIATGANSVILSPSLRMETGRSSRVTMAGEETLESQLDVLRCLAEYLRDAGVSVSIKPDVCPLDGTWNALIDPENPQQWFSSLKGYLLSYARMAEATGVTALYLTNENQSMVANPDNEGAWRDIIAAIREVFSGEISVNAIINNAYVGSTTARNVWETEVMNIPFADALDFIGVSFYLPLTNKTDPTVGEIKRAWHGNREGLDIIGTLEEIHRRYGKSVMISEIAYRALDGTNMTPYMATDRGVDLQEQCDLFEALLQILSSEGEGWIRGVSIYGWFAYPEPDTQMAYLGELISASVQGKPAERLLTDWFHRLGGRTPPDLESVAPEGSSICFDTSHEPGVFLTEAEARQIDPVHPEWHTLTGLEPYVTCADDTVSLSEELSADNCDMLILAVPGQPLSAVEQQALETYVDDGGSLLVIGNAWSTPLNLGKFDVRFGQATIGEPSHLYDFATFEVPCERHPATKYTNALVVNWGCTMTVGTDWTVLARTSTESWEETIGDGLPSAGERSGPFSVFAVREYGNGRVAAVADEHVFSLYGDSFFIRTLLDWLLGN